MKIRAIIIEDIPSYNETLSLMLQNNNDIELVATASSKAEAIEKIVSLNPDLLFLDIQLGKHNGFEILDECKGYYKYVVFTTCHEEFALKGYEYPVAHYLLKPIEEEQLLSAIEKVKFCLISPNSLDSINNSLFKIHNLKGKKIFFPDKNVHHAIEVDSIIMVESDSSYSNIFTLIRKIKISKNLSYMQNLLIDFEEFKRVHRGYIINTNHITNVKRGLDSHLTLTNGHVVPVSNNIKGDLFTFLGIKE